MMALTTGDLAPDAALTRDNARTVVSLSEYLGERPLVLLFFPFAFSSTCTEEMCAVAEDYTAYEDLGAQVLGISVDSPYANARFAAELGTPFPILSDFNRVASRAYGVLRETFGQLEGVSERAAFVIGGDGRVTFAWVGEPGDLPPLDEIKAALAGG
jgi:glutaredoxin-dependent peroxiredoxin